MPLCHFLNPPHPYIRLFVLMPDLDSVVSLEALSSICPLTPFIYIPSPLLTVSAFLLRQRRRACRGVYVLTGYVLGDKYAPIRLRHWRDGRKKWEWRRWVHLLFRQVVIMGGEALVQHTGAVGEGSLGAASLLLGQSRGGADAGE